MNCKVNKFSPAEKLAFIEPFVKKLQAVASVEEKLKIANSQPIVEEFLTKQASLKRFIAELDNESELIIKILLAVGQGPLFFGQMHNWEAQSQALKTLIQHLLEVENFYSFMGGLAGYYYYVIKLLVEKEKDLGKEDSKEAFLQCPGFDISKDSLERRQFVRIALERLVELAAIFPVGGAGDRLDLRDEGTGEALPAAYLPMGGFSLLEGLFRDLQAIEFLSWKITGEQPAVPIALMTSPEKNNDANVALICEQHAHFGRPPEKIKHFIQPLVPVITVEGNFSLLAPLVLKLKPGGHGVLWKLALEQGIFSWFEALGRKKLLIRQINNPMAGTDDSILAFVGAGIKMNKIFGFASCDRQVNASEGMIVLHEKQSSNVFRYSVINIEYTDFQAKGIQDVPKEPGSPFSSYPANTNILFADLKAMCSLVHQVAVPGLIINMKNKVPHLDENGSIREVYGGRLESMMQNISEAILDEFPVKMTSIKSEQLSCYVTYGERKKVISVTKKKYSPEKSLRETPEGCFYDQMVNCRDLFSQDCKFKLPEMRSEIDFMQQGPSFIIRYHPALGPLYKVIAQKVQEGLLKERSELVLEITELHSQGLIVDGSLHVIAKSPLGTLDEEGVVSYSNQSGKCELENVKVSNRGIDWQAKNSYWKNEICRHELLEVILHGNAEFFASNVHFEGGMRIEVPAGTRMEVTMQNGKPAFHSRKITSPTWYWKHSFDKSDTIILSKLVGL